MKKYLLYGVALGAFGLAATPLISQTQTTTSSSSSGYIQTTKIVGTKVKTQQGEEVGVVKDVILDRSNGCMAYTVLSTGGSGTRVTGQGKLVAVPWSVYSVSPDMSYLTTTVERDRIYNGPVFEYSRIGDASYTSSVYSAFGASAGVGFSNASTTTTGASTTTGATTQSQTGAYASPAANPAASASPGVSASPAVAASASAAPTASSSPATSASPSKSARGAKGGSTPSASAHHKGDETMKEGAETSGESVSETTGGTKSSKGSKKSTSAEKSIDAEESSAETGESPSGKKTSHKKSSKPEGTETAPSPGEQE